MARKKKEINKDAKKDNTNNIVKVEYDPPIQVICVKDVYMGVKSKLDLGETYLCRAEKDTTLKILYEIKYGRDWEWHDSVKFEKVEE